MSDMLRNQFRAGLESGKTQFGVWLGIPDSTAAEIMAGAGFDWLLIDQEHGAFELREIMAHLQALAAYNVAPIVRPVNGDAALLKKLCDVGAQSFIVPMIDTAEQAAEVVSAVRYPPEGRRGMGTSLARAARWNSVPGYLGRANEEMLVVVQAETTTAIDNLEAIAGTPGIDGVFIGPSDLSASMGHVGGVSHPEVVQTVADALRTIRAAGKHAGLLCLDESQIAHYEECGANFVGVGVDTLLLGNAARGLAARCKTGDESSSEAGY
ncbi:MAG: aldolase/citrate lyase family protein [Gammaproteobacteria bacterium]|nr:aldolase/citrate lyase family protein [Gammaproteobacteria bacterium]